MNLVQQWHERFGFAPPFTNGAVAGSHFALRDGGRGVVISRPNTLQVEGSVRVHMLALIAAKHSVQDVRIANPQETPTMRVRERLPEQHDFDAVEEWPPPAERDEPVVAEYLGGTGVFVGDQLAPWFAANDVEHALTFADADDAEDYLARHALQRRVVLRYLSAARAEQDQREAALFNG